jgi:hypothetical protein
MSDVEKMLNYHIGETNRRLERIENQLDLLIELKGNISTQARVAAAIVSCVLSIACAVLSRMFYS